ncbi:MAG: hypothetical protein Kapaf2KO_10790 [Candidatus Kapaibacteriales bacterium]
MENKKVIKQTKKADQKKLSEKEMKNTKGGGWSMSMAGTDSSGGSN